MWRALLLAVVVLASVPPGAGQAALPEGCAADGEAVLCQWRFDNRESRATSHEFPIPVLERMHVTVTIVQEGVDGGWQLRLFDDADERFDEQAHSPRTDSGRVVRTTLQTLALGLAPGTGTLVLRLISDGFGANGASSFTGGGLGTPSLGAFTVSYRAAPLGLGAPPERPAATREDPHLLGAPLDARRGAFDLTAAWLDDPALGDALIEARVAVVDLQDWGWREGGTAIVHRFAFRVLGVDHRIDWEAVALDPLARVEDADVTCNLVRVFGTANEEPLLRPACEFDWTRGELVAVIPEAALGSPGDGVPFTHMSAMSHARAYSRLGYNSPLDTVEDRLSGERYAFALGGPPVWDVLNPRLAVPPEPVPAWYEAPLRRENVPDTLQVVGALLAASTFLFGVIVVRRHRRQTRGLLARIDALMAAHEREARAGLLALGDLETEVSTLYRQGKLTDAQYQVLTQRISGAAARLALRHGLGLDDGVPGGGGSRAVPVQAPDAPETRGPRR